MSLLNKALKAIKGEKEKNPDLVCSSEVVGSETVPTNEDAESTPETSGQIHDFNLKTAAVEQIKTVYDPEIPVNIWDLGLIYEVTPQNEDKKVHILMTLTAPACPAAETIPEEIKQKVSTLPGVEEVEIELTFDPPWDKEMMSEEAKLELGFL